MYVSFKNFKVQSQCKIVESTQKNQDSETGLNKRVFFISKLFSWNKYSFISCLKDFLNENRITKL